MPVDFVKMHGLGNDFIVIDRAPNEPLPSAARWQALSDRHTGIGFDQALVLEHARTPGARAAYRVFNADGSEVEQCGNGVRCVAWLLQLRQPLAGDEMLLDSGAGPVRARVRAAGMVSVDMGIPDFKPAALPFDAPAEALRYSVKIGGDSVDFGAVSLGNPHVVLTVADVETAPVATLGPALESHRFFPQRVNVGFMQIVDRDRIRLRVYERGVGETQACGTGACAAVAVGVRHGRLGPRVEVNLPGGELLIEWPGEGQRLWMTGPAAVAYRGQIELTENQST